jgi:hypothetical protein
MEVKNPLFKEDFGVSSNNIFASASSMPPAYSTVAANKENEEAKAENLVDLDANGNKTDKTNTTTESK